MAESVRVLPEDIQKLIEVHQWDMRTRLGVQRFRELKARSLPSVALDGELVYEAIIPPQEELIEAIQKRYAAKNPADVGSP
jgi:predicted thioredoxin/glutaredoxin